MRRPLLLLLLTLTIAALTPARAQVDSTDYVSPADLVENYSYYMNIFINKPSSDDNSDVRKWVYGCFHLYTRDNPMVAYYRMVYPDIDSMDDRGLQKSEKTSIHDYLDEIWYLNERQRTRITAIVYALQDTLSATDDRMQLVVKKTVSVDDRGKPLAYALLERFYLRFNYGFNQWEIEQIAYHGPAEVTKAESEEPPTAVQLPVTDGGGTTTPTLEQYYQSTAGVIRKRKTVGVDLAGHYFVEGGTFDARLRIGRLGLTVDYLSVLPFDSADYYYYPASGDGSITYDVNNNQAFLVGAGYYMPYALGGRDMYLGGGIGVYNYRHYEITASSSYGQNSISSTTVAFKLQLRLPEWRVGPLGIQGDLVGLLAPPVAYAFSYALMPRLHLGETFSFFARLGGWSATGNKGFSAGLGLSLLFNPEPPKK